MGYGTENEVVVQSQVPAVAQESGDSKRALPIRLRSDGDSSTPVVINDKEFPLSPNGSPPATLDDHNRAYSEKKAEFSEWNLPVLQNSDTTILGEMEQSQALNAIASSNEPVLLNLGEDLPNQVAKPDSLRLEKNSSLDCVRTAMCNPRALDVICRLINMRDCELDFRGFAAAAAVGKQCGGGGKGGSGKGSQTESSTSQGGQHEAFVTGYTGSGLATHMVSGLGRRCGGGGGGDDDPFEKRPPQSLSGHYADFAGFEEQPSGTHRDAHVGLLAAPTGLSPMLPVIDQFVQNREDLPSCSLPSSSSLFPLDSVDGMELDLLFDEIIQASLQVEPAEETLAALDNMNIEPMEETLAAAFSPDILIPNTPAPIVEEVQSDIGHAFDIIHLMSMPAQRNPVLNPTVVIQPTANSIPLSQIHGLGLPPVSPSLPSPGPSLPPMTPLAPSPSPSIYSSVPTPLTPRTPSSPSESNGFFCPNSYIEGENRVCELVVPTGALPDTRNVAIRALYYAASEYQKILECMEENFDLKVASDARAVMCPFDFQPKNLKVEFMMPKECKQLSQWLLKPGGVELTDRLLVLQQVINTLATIHTLGHNEKLSLWGSFMVWVAPNLRAYLLVDFALFFRKQEELMCSPQTNPRMFDIQKVHKLYNELVCVGPKNSSWLSPGLVNIFSSFGDLINDVSSTSRMAEAARTLGERRVCRLDIEICHLPITLYCVEQEGLQTALRALIPVIPWNIAEMWIVQSISNAHSSLITTRPNIVTMGAGDKASADRKMYLILQPCDPSSPVLGTLYITLRR